MRGRNIRSAEPTDWRPWHWFEGDVIVEFRDGSRRDLHELEADTQSEWEDWHDDLMRDIDAELGAAGFSTEVDEDLGELVYTEDAQQALRWRPLSELPEWARPTPSEPAPASPPPRRGTA